MDFFVPGIKRWRAVHMLVTLIINGYGYTTSNENLVSMYSLVIITLYF